MDAIVDETTASALPNLAPSGTQRLSVSGFITDRLLVTYRAEAARLAPLVPRPLVLDTHRGHGFVSVCAVEIVDMHVAATPRALWFDNRELLYRISVLREGRPSFLTLRSDVSSRALAWLGARFSHYRPRRAAVTLARRGTLLEMRCESGDGAGDASVIADLACAPPWQTSLFGDAEAASSFLLGMSFSVDVVGERVRTQAIVHAPWQPRAVALREARFAYLDRLADALDAPLAYDCTLAVHGVSQTWKAACWR